VVVLLRGRDTMKCEDLGRQLRELRRSLRGRLPLVVWTARGDSVLVSTFLRRENVSADALAGVAVDSVYAAEGRVVTPAVLVARDGGAAVHGIAHSRRFPNSRLRSFTQEMDDVLSQALQR
jgi:hypothetical protein